MAGPVPALPRGRHDFSREHVEHSQRTRLLEAVVQQVGRAGPGSVTVATLVAAAGVSREAFYGQFANKEDALLQARAAFVQTIADALEAGGDRLEDRLRAYCRVLSGHRDAARTFLLHDGAGTATEPHPVEFPGQAAALAAELATDDEVSCAAFLALVRRTVTEHVATGHLDALPERVRELAGWLRRRPAPDAQPQDALTLAREQLLALERDDGEALSRIVGLAAQLLDVPVTLATIVDEGRQVFAGRFGLPAEWDAAGQSPLSHSLCRHVVEEAAPLVLADVRAVPAFRDHLATRDLGVTAYAGMPLRGADDVTIGAVCAIDARPRTWTDRELALLRSFSEVVADRLELQRLRREQVGTDPLTGLLTRPVFELLADRTVSGDDRAVLVVGVTGLGRINDAHGRDGGDRVLQEVARRVQDATGSRPACRLGGDEFASMAPAGRAATRTADALRVALMEPYELDGVQQRLDAAVGVATARDGETVADLLEAASAALRRSRDGIGPQVRERDQRSATATATVREALWGATARGEMDVHFQPIVSMTTGEVRGLEALLRWTHPTLGRLSPARFVAVAERSGAIVPIGEWVLERACECLSAWRRLAGRADLVVSVNVAPVQLATPGFAVRWREVLERHGLPASAVGLEITERTLLERDRGQQAALAQLAAAGSRIALDDFGTGYSALSYLTSMSVDTIKIDGGFVTSVATSRRSQDVVAGVLGLAERLGIVLVAEGVETAGQHEALRGIGVPLAQGYRYARPAGADEVTARLSAACPPLPART